MCPLWFQTSCLMSWDSSSASYASFNFVNFVWIWIFLGVFKARVHNRLAFMVVADICHSYYLRHSHSVLFLLLFVNGVPSGRAIFQAVLADFFLNLNSHRVLRQRH